MSENIYKINGLSCDIGGRKILDNVEFGISAGEFVVIIGPNGAGKSTILKNMIRVYPPQPGKILLFGKCLLEFRQRDIAADVGYVPQSSPVYLPFTALQFVMMGLYPRLNPLVRPGPEETKRALACLENVGMADFADRQIDTLSGGERQKIFIAASLAQSPRILLLDEPTTYLDPRHQVDIYNILMRENMKNNLAVLAVTHDVNFACRFAKRIIALKKGRIFFDGDIDGMIISEKLASLYDTEFEIIKGKRPGEKYAFPLKTND